jgi:hypothetical protein
VGACGLCNKWAGLLVTMHACGFGKKPGCGAMSRGRARARAWKRSVGFLVACRYRVGLVGAEDVQRWMERDDEVGWFTFSGAKGVCSLKKKAMGLLDDECMVL